MLLGLHRVFGCPPTALVGTAGGVSAARDEQQWKIHLSVLA